MQTRQITPLKRIPKQPTRPISSVHINVDALVQDLLLALKDVVACQSMIATNNNGRHTNKTNELELQKLRIAVNKVVSLHRRVKDRITGLDENLEEAGAKIDIDLKQLLNDCLRFPEVFPYVKNEQGLRKFFLCYCGEKESFDQHGLRLCSSCLEDTLECLKEKKKDKRFILYSTYSAEVRCRHADFKTLLVTFNKPGYWLPSWCQTCLIQEKQRLSK